jgi:hypothetical protein
MNKPLSFSLLAVLLLAACGGPTASPTPSGGPTGSPGPTGSHGPSPTPSPSPTPTFGADQISHPTGGADLVLQMEQGGGLMGWGFFITQAPSFSLYGDGTVIIQPSGAATRLVGAGLPPFRQARMSEEQVQALLRFALGQGRLLGARASYGQMGCADCGSTVFKINAADISKTISIDALGMAEVPADSADRAGFMALAETLGGFEARMDAGEMGEVTTYDPPVYRVVMLEAQPGQGEPIAWPWTDVAWEDFASVEQGFQLEAVLTLEQVAQVVEVPSGGHNGIIVEAPNDKLWSLGVRPLLPDEIAAAGQG